MSFAGLILDCSIRLDTAMCAEARTAGYVAAIRYLYPDPSAPKTLTAPEAAVIRAAGLALGLVWETTAGRALDGTAAGISDAATANRIADELGPAATGAAIYYACDIDAAWPDVAPYYNGIKSVSSSRRRGAYAGVPVLAAALTARYIDLSWVAAASSWSHGQTMTADLWQQVGPAPLAFSADTNIATTSDPGVVPILAPSPPTRQNGDQMLILTIDAVDYLFWCAAGTLWYRAIRSGTPQGAVRLSDQADPTNPLLTGAATAYGPIVYAAATGGRNIRVTQTPGAWGLTAEVL